MKRPREDDENEECIPKRVKLDTEEAVAPTDEAMETTEPQALVETEENDDAEMEENEEDEEDGSESDEEDDEDDDDDDDDEDEIHTINAEQYKWHFDMLNDTERVQAFARGLTKTMNQLEKPNEELVVLDIGAGTGYLGLCAAKQGCKTCYFIDSDPVLVEIINENVNNNEVSSNCVAVPGLSSEVQIPEKADILVAEVLDSGLIGENFLVTLRDAKERLCQPHAVVVPAQAQVFGMLVESDTLASFQTFSDLNLDPCGNPSCIHFEKLVSSGQAKTLSEPFSVFDFDFNNLPSAEGRTLKQSVPVTQSGKLSVVVYFWQCSIDRESEFTISTANNQSRSHWRHAVSFLKSSEQIDLQQGNNVDVHCFHSDEDIWFSLSENTNDTITVPTGHELFSTFLPEHVALWNDKDIVNKLTSELAYVQGKACFNITGNVFLTKLLADLGATKVISIDSDPMALTYETPCEIKYIEDPSQMDDDVECTFFPPYELADFGWNTLLFCYQNNIYPQVFPNSAKLYVSAIECEILWNMYQTVDDIENISLEAVNQMHIQDQIITGQYWMYDHTVLCSPTVVQTFEFGSMPEQYNLDINLPLTTAGQFDFLVFWFDFNDLGIHHPSKVFAYQGLQRSETREQVTSVSRNISINLNEEIFSCVDPANVDISEVSAAEEMEVVPKTTENTLVSEQPALVAVEE